ncbi:MAG: 3-methyl-2-oxobutanoate hydroxymethyltransferase [Kiritimatiellaeota bacterium]|nr:3-methyl-2-oxobutanoate hydroxymethyltransferase [Kiritimatiellota bacterium]
MLHAVEVPEEVYWARDESLARTPQFVLRTGVWYAVETMKPWTPRSIKNQKGKAPIACLTAYDALMARIIDEAGIPLILVGDSLANTALGFDSTVPATLEMMAHHTAAVVRGVTNALVVADMPFLTYHFTPQETLRNAGRLIQEAGADAVKIEGGVAMAQTVKLLTSNGIPVLGHIGLLPQSFKQTGYRTRGKTPAEARTLLADAKAIAEAGAFAIVIECVEEAVARRITRAVPVPTIGIGSGTGCDGQVRVIADILGLAPDAPKFVTPYVNLRAAIARAVTRYKQELNT